MLRRVLLVSMLVLLIGGVSSGLAFEGGEPGGPMDQYQMNFKRENLGTALGIDHIFYKKAGETVLDPASIGSMEELMDAMLENYAWVSTRPRWSGCCRSIKNTSPRSARQFMMPRRPFSNSSG